MYTGGIIRAFYDQNSRDAAISTQLRATYGDLRSPIRANFQNVPSILWKRKVREFDEYVIWWCMYSSGWDWQVIFARLTLSYSGRWMTGRMTADMYTYKSATESPTTNFESWTKHSAREKKSTLANSFHFSVQNSCSFWWYEPFSQFLITMNTKISSRFTPQMTCKQQRRYFQFDSSCNTPFDYERRT